MCLCVVLNKCEMGQHKVKNPKASLDMFAQHFRRCFGHVCGKSTIVDIVKNKDKWPSIAEDETSLS